MSSPCTVAWNSPAGLPELPLAVTLAVGVPTNERMDALVEKATELGVAAIQPLWTERAVLRLDGERAERRRAHWQAVAVAASEQSGRAWVPVVAQPVVASAAAPVVAPVVAAMGATAGPPTAALDFGLFDVIFPFWISAFVFCVSCKTEVQGG